MNLSKSKKNIKNKKEENILFPKYEKISVQLLSYVHILVCLVGINLFQASVENRRYFRGFESDSF